MGEFPGFAARLEYLINADVRDFNFWYEQAVKKEAKRRQIQLYYARLAYVGGEQIYEELTGLDWLVRGDERAAQAMPLIEEEEKEG